MISEPTLIFQKSQKRNSLIFCFFFLYCASGSLGWWNGRHVRFRCVCPQGVWVQVPSRAPYVSNKNWALRIEKIRVKNEIVFESEFRGFLMERWQSGWSRSSRKAVCRKVTGVRISLSPPEKSKKHLGDENVWESRIFGTSHIPESESPRSGTTYERGKSPSLRQKIINICRNTRNSIV